MSQRASLIRRICEFHPLLLPGVLMVAGIVAGEASDINLTFCIVATCLLAVVALFTSRWRTLAVILIGVAFFGIGMTVVTIQEKATECQLPSGYVGYEGVVTSEPTATKRGVRADVSLTGKHLTGKSVRLWISCEEGQKPKVGDGIAFTTLLRKPKNTRKSSFDYLRYLRARGIVGVGSVREGDWKRANVDVKALPVTTRSQLTALRLRHRLIERYGELGLAGDALAVTSAMTLGEKSGLTPELRKVYSSTGTSHILALSGMHLGIVHALILMFTLSSRRLTKAWSTLLVTGSVWFFVWLVGMPASVVRAATMLTLFSILRLSQRDALSINVLVCAGMGMLLVNPLSLYDIGLQLSFVSVAAIVMFAGPIGSLIDREFLMRHPILRYFWQLAVMSTVAQAATMPLCIYYFETTSLCFLLANFIVIPSATIILYAGVAVFAFWPLPALSALAASVAGVTAAALNTSLRWLAAIPGSAVEGIHLSLGQAAAAEVMVFALLQTAVTLVRMHKRRRAAYQWDLDGDV